MLDTLPPTGRPTLGQQRAVQRLLTRDETTSETLTAAIAHPAGSWTEHVCANPNLAVGHVHQLAEHPWRLAVGSYDRASLLVQLVAHPARQVSDTARAMLDPDAVAEADGVTVAFAIWAARNRARRWLTRHASDDALDWIAALFSGSYQLGRVDLAVTNGRHVPRRPMAREHRQTARNVLRQMLARRLQADVPGNRARALLTVASGVGRPHALTLLNGPDRGNTSDVDATVAWCTRRLGGNLQAWQLLATLLYDTSALPLAEQVELATTLTRPVNTDHDRERNFEVSSS